MCSLHFVARVFTISALCFVPAALVAEDLPDMRPALVGSAPNALVNLINTQALMKRGVQHGAVLFRCLVYPSGSTAHRIAYGGTPDSEALRLEVKNKLYPAKFTPAVYNHHNTYAWFYGTVTFSVIDGKPHLRVYANQEKSQLAEGADFIGPQSIYIATHTYDPRPRMKEAFGSWALRDIPGTVDLELTVPVNGGQLKEVRVLQENPPGKNFGEYAMNVLKEFTWLPAYRNGHPVEIPTHLTFTFLPRDWYWK